MRCGRRHNNLRQLVLFPVLSVACAACDSVLAVRCGTTPVAEPRIAWGAGADGVRMGDTEEAVCSNLGEPDGDYFVDWYGTSHGLSWDEGPTPGCE